MAPLNPSARPFEPRPASEPWAIPSSAAHPLHDELPSDPWASDTTGEVRGRKMARSPGGRLQPLRRPDDCL